VKQIALSIALIWFALIWLAGRGWAQDQQLTLEQVASLAIENDASVLKSAETLEASINEYRSLQADKHPRLSLDTAYGVDYSSKKQDDFGEYEKLTLHSVTLGFSVEQLVPTYGTLSAGISDTMTVRKGIADLTYDAAGPIETDPLFSQSPSFSLSYRQPMFFNGKIIDMALYRAVFRKGEIDYRRAAEQSRLTKNRAVYDAVSLLFDLVGLQNEKDMIEQAIELKKRGVENLQRNLEQGLVAENKVWEMRVELGKERENLLRNLYAVRDKQGRLALALGISGDATIVPARELLQPELGFEVPESPPELYRNNPGIRRTELAVEDARLNRIIDGSNGASTLTFSFSISPRYPYARQLELEAGFSESFTDFGDELAGIDLNIKTELKVPLYTGSKWRHKAAADKAVESSLQHEAAYQKSDLLRTLRMLLLRRENLAERILLLDDNMKLKKMEAEVGRALVEVGEIAELDVIEMEIEHLQKRNELERAKMDRYLTTLDILSILGQDLGEVLQGRS